MDVVLGTLHIISRMKFSQDTGTCSLHLTCDECSSTYHVFLAILPLCIHVLESQQARYERSIIITHLCQHFTDTLHSRVDIDRILFLLTRIRLNLLALVTRHSFLLRRLSEV